MLDLNLYNKLSKSNKAIVIMSLMGYDITKNGELITYKGAEANYHLWRGYKSYSFRFPARVFGRLGAQVLLHRFQAYKKYGCDLFERGVVVRHKNNSKLDNSWKNILIGTSVDNYHDNPRELNERVNRKLISSAAEQRRSKNLDLMTKVYFDREENGFSYKDLSDKYGLSKSALSFHFGKNKSVSEDYVKLIKDNIKIIRN